MNEITLAIGVVVLTIVELVVILRVIENDGLYRTIALTLASIRLGLAMSFLFSNTDVRLLAMLTGVMTFLSVIQHMIGLQVNRAKLLPFLGVVITAVVLLTVAITFGYLDSLPR